MPNYLKDIPIEFQTGCRVQMLINRAVGNSHKGSKRWVTKLISQNPEGFQRNCEKLLEQQAFLGNQDIRLYSSINDRNINKAIKTFKHRQIDAMDIADFHANCHNNFISALMAPESKFRHYYLVDIDTTDTKVFSEIESLIRALQRDIEYSYPTPSGYHMIIKPFDMRVLSKFLEKRICEVKKDGLMLISFMEETSDEAKD